MQVIGREAVRVHAKGSRHGVRAQKMQNQRGEFCITESVLALNTAGCHEVMVLAEAVVPF
jgi:hypothetical protein